MASESLRPSPDPQSHDDVVMSLLDETLQWPQSERESRLRRVCGRRDDLFHEVWRRVQSAEKMGSFLLTPLVSADRLDAETEFAPGTKLADRFRIVRTVARGGMGIVYEAWDERLDKRVAVKCARAAYRRRLPPEVRNATEITHPNVCRVFELYTIRLDGEEIDFLTMEFLEGPTLAGRLTLGPLSREEARDIALQLCDGLAEAHRRQVVHGDLKANNVVLCRNDSGETRAVITDFGLARAMTSLQTAAALDVGGAPDYMAPELWSGGKPSIASDIYALGVMLFELAHGDKPQPADVEQHGFAVSAWDRCVRRCMAVDPDERFARAEDVAAALSPPARRRWMLGLLMIAAVVAAPWAWRSIGPGSRAAAPSIAVIPFVDEGLSAGNQYFAESLSDSLIGSLAQFPNINVIARSSSVQFRGPGHDLREVARRLGVSHLVTGHVSQTGGEIAVGVELLDGQSVRLWGDRYTATTGGLATLEQRITQAIAERVGTRVSVGANGTRAATARPEAYEYLLRGQYQRRLYTPESRQLAVGYFERALAIDPQFALAHAELANIYRLLAGGGILDAADAIPRAEAAVRRALAADPNLAEAHFVLADIEKDRWNFARADEEYRAAIALSPSLADAHMGYGILLSVLGRTAEAVEEVQKVHALDPVGLPGKLHAAAVYYNARRYDEALKELERARELDPRAPSAWMWTGMVYAGSGRYDAAVRAYEEAIALNDRTAATQCFFAYALAKSGRSEQARRILSAVLDGDQFVPPTALAVAYAGLGDQDEALRYLQRAYDARDPILQYLKVESHYDSLHDRQAYADLARRVGLP